MAINHSNTFQVESKEELMKFLITILPHKNRNNIKTLLRDKQVVVNGEIVTQFNHLLEPGNVVEISNIKLSKEKSYQGFTIVFEDEYIVVIDKHAGILSIATDKEKTKTAYSMLSVHVKKQSPANKIFVVHRLDRETSGLLMFAKSEKTQRTLQESWHENVTEKTYLAVVEGQVKDNEGTITSYIKESKALISYSSQNPEHGEKAITHYQVLKRNKQYSLLKIELETGKKNQIRLHMKDIGHCIVGDKKYGSNINPIGRVALHAWILTFKHPVTGEEMRFETALPRKFTRLF
jgi:23S rRNA pseudouridine1911/1915/1917 synthase